MMSIVRASVIFLALPLFFALTGCRPSADGAGSILHGFERDDARSIDPADAYDSISLDIVPEIYEPLLEYDYGSAEYRLRPLLAESMPELSPDRKRMVVRLRRGVRFQDDPCFKETGGRGREVVAADFAYALGRLALPSLNASGWWILDKKVAGANEFRDRLFRASSAAERKRIFEEGFEGVRATDDHTLVFRFTHPYPTFKYILAMAFLAPIPHEAIEAYATEKGDLPDHAVGTGPYRLKAWERNRRIVLERNPTYRGAEFEGRRIPAVDGLVLDIIREDQPAWLKFLRGEIDSMSVPKDELAGALPLPGQLSPELKAKGIRLILPNPVRIHYLAFNMRDPLLGGNKRLRQAISSLIDRQEWIRVFTNGLGLEAANAVPPGIADRPATSMIRYGYDLSRAQDLLAQAGYPGGRGLPPLAVELRGADSANRQLGEMLTRQLAAGGVKVNVVYNTFPAYLTKVAQGRYQVALGSWGLDYPDAENIYQLLYSPNIEPGTNMAGFRNPEMNRLYERISELEPGRERAALIQRMDDILQEECPWALGIFSIAPRLAQPWLKGFRGDPYIPNPLKYYRIER